MRPVTGLVLLASTLGFVDPQLRGIVSSIERTVENVEQEVESFFNFGQDGRSERTVEYEEIGDLRTGQAQARSGLRSQVRTASGSGSGQVSMEFSGGLQGGGYRASLGGGRASSSGGAQASLSAGGQAGRKAGGKGARSGGFQRSRRGVQQVDKSVSLQESIPRGPPAYSLSGWLQVNRTMKPEGEGSYLAVTKAGVYRLQLSNLPGIQADKVIGMKISLDYWTRFEPDAHKLSPIDIAIRPCWHSTVRSVDPSTMNSDSGGWKTLSYIASDYSDSAGDIFTYTKQQCLDEVVIEVKIARSASDATFVALKNIVIEYDITASEQSSSGSSPVMTIVRRCTSMSECADFSWASKLQMRWSASSTQAIPFEGTSYYAPENYGDLLSFQFSNLKETSSARVTLRYWVSAASQLMISPYADFGLSSGSEGRGDIKGFSLYHTLHEGQTQWMDINFWLSDLHPNVDGATNVTVYMKVNTADGSSDSDTAALNLMKVEWLQRNSLLTESAPKFFVAWDSVYSERHGAWTTWPSKNFGGETGKSHNEREVIMIISDLGESYIMSEWYAAELGVELNLKYRLEIRSLDGVGSKNSIVAELTVVDAFYNVVYSEDMIADPTDQTITIPALSREDDQDNTLRRVIFNIVAIDESAIGLKLVLSRVSLGDGCVDNDKLCVGETSETCRHGKRANTYECVCKAGFSGRHCSHQDFCEKFDGYDKCKLGGASEPYCRSHPTSEHDPPYDCVCGLNQYWDQAEGACVKISVCDGVIDCPIPFTKCDDSLEREIISEDTLCNACIQGYERVSNSNSTISCQPIDLCRNKGTANCDVIEYPSGERQRVIWCPLGFRKVYDERSDSYRCETQFEDRCPDIIRTASNCEHGCRISYNSFTGLSDVQCTCFNGWRYDSINRRCVKDANLVCQGHRISDDICIRNQRGDTEWICQPGTFRDGDNLCSRDFCTMAKGDPARGVSPNQDLKSEIGSVCGNTDECQASEDYLFGKPFWRFVCQCKNNQIVNPKTGRCEYIDLCGQGQEFREKCEAQGKVCRRLGDIRDPEFLCGCAPGQAIDETTGACADQCSVAAYQRKCSMKNAKCRPNFVKLEPDCVCQDGMTTVNGQVNGCGVNKYAFYTRPLIISPSYAEIMRIKLIRQGLPSFTIDEAPQCENDPLAEACAKYLKSLANGTTEWPLVSPEDILRHERYLMSERIRTSLTNLYLDFSGFNHQGLSLYSFEPATASSYDIKITMPFSDKIDSSTVLSRLTEHCRSAPSVNQQYCTLPGGINIDRSFLVDSEDDPLPLSTEIDPCTTTDGYGRPYCPQGTECKRLEGLSHQCTCGKGTNFLGSVRLNQAGTAFKEICVDLDECTEQGNPCGLNATCVNRVGSFDCECKFGFRKDDQGRCKSVCDGVECGSGTRCVPREGWCPGYSCEYVEPVVNLSPKNSSSNDRIWIEPVVIKTPEPIIETVYIQEKSKPETIIRENRSVPAPEPVKEPEPEPQYSCETVTTCQPAPPDVFRRNTSNKGQTRQVNACNTCGQSSCGCAAGGSCGMCNMAPPTCNIVNAPLPKKELEEEEEESYDA